MVLEGSPGPASGAVREVTCLKGTGEPSLVVGPHQTCPGSGRGKVGRAAGNRVLAGTHPRNQAAEPLPPSQPVPTLSQGHRHRPTSLSPNTVPTC